MLGIGIGRMTAPRVETVALVNRSPSVALEVAAAQRPKLAVLDVSTAFVQELRSAGQTALELDELTRFRIHGVTGAGRQDGVVGQRSGRSGGGRDDNASRPLPSRPVCL